MARFEIVSTQPTIYHDPAAGVINGVLVNVKLLDYDEYHQIRVPKMDVSLVKQAIESLLEQRDKLAELSD